MFSLKCWVMWLAVYFIVRWCSIEIKDLSMLSQLFTLVLGVMWYLRELLFTNDVSVIVKDVIISKDVKVDSGRFDVVEKVIDEEFYEWVREVEGRIKRRTESLVKSVKDQDGLSYKVSYLFRGRRYVYESLREKWEEWKRDKRKREKMEEGIDMKWYMFTCGSCGGHIS